MAAVVRNLFNGAGSSNKEREAGSGSIVSDDSNGGTYDGGFSESTGSRIAVNKDQLDFMRRAGISDYQGAEVYAAYQADLDSRTMEAKKKQSEVEGAKVNAAKKNSTAPSAAGRQGTMSASSTAPVTGNTLLTGSKTLLGQ